MKNTILLKLIKNRLSENMAAGLGTMSNPSYVSGDLVHDRIKDKLEKYKKNKQTYLKRINNEPIL